MPEIRKYKRVHVPRQAGLEIVSQPSEWANPFDVGRHGDQSQVRELYSSWLKNQGALLSRIDELRGLDLICRTTDVHAELLFFLANGSAEDRKKWWAS